MELTGGGPPPRAGRREWLGLAVLALPTMLTMLDISVLFLALPHLTVDLAATASQQLWISDSYGFLIAGLLVTMGTLGDRYGRRRVLLSGAAGFAAVSVLAAFAPSAELLIAARVLLGVAGAAIMPSTLALIFRMFPEPQQRAVAISVWATALTGGVALGPVVGGVLLELFWWGSVFLVGVPVTLLLLVTGRALLPEVRSPDPGRPDPASVLLSLAAVLLFVAGFKEIARSGWQAGPVLAVVTAVGCGVAFGLRQRRLPDPLLDLRLFTIRAVSGALVLALLVAAVQGGSGFFVAQYLQVVEGLSPLRAGLWVLVPTTVLIIAIFLSQGLARRLRPAHVLAGGLAVSAGGMAVLSQTGPGTSLALLLAGFAIVYLGVGPVGPLVSQLVVPAAPPEKAGAAAALQTTSGELGVAVGIAGLGSVGVAVYRQQVAVPAELAGTQAGTAAGETAPGALEAARALPPAAAEALVDSARAAFTAGLATAATVCLLIFAGLAGLALATLRHLPPVGAGSPEPPVGAGGPEPPARPAGPPREEPGG